MVRTPITPGKLKNPVLIGAVGFALLAIIFIVILAIMLKPPVDDQTPTAELVVIPAATQTPIAENIPQQVTPTSSDNLTGPFTVGMYVQISGTGGVGLYIREAPGVNSPARFLGMDSEVFKVIDGARESGGLLWYLLEAPYDESRSGWAAADYLQVVSP